MTGGADKPVALEVDGMTLTFVTLQDFEFCLDARTQVPSSKVEELRQQVPALVHEEARSIRRVERRFMDVLSDAMDDPKSLATSMRDLDRQLFSQDYRWRGIIAAVNTLPDSHDDFRRAAMVRYLEYLRSRQNALRSAYDEQRAKSELAIPEAVLEPEGPPSLRETAIFEVADLAPELGGKRLQRLPRGETVKLRVTDEPLRLMLSQYAFELHCTVPLTLIDPEGAEHTLGRERSVVGRDLANDVVVDAAFRDVSRRHLIIETSTPGWVQLTDLSSHGTHVDLHR